MYTNEGYTYCLVINHRTLRLAYARKFVVTRIVGKTEEIIDGEVIANCQR
jgi:hypothetical protein